MIDRHTRSLDEIIDTEINELITHLDNLTLLTIRRNIRCLQFLDNPSLDTKKRYIAADDECKNYSPKIADYNEGARNFLARPLLQRKKELKLENSSIERDSEIERINIKLEILFPTK